MPCYDFAISPSTSERVCWISWVQEWPSGTQHVFARRASIQSARRFARRHGLPTPDPPETRRGKKGR